MNFSPPAGHRVKLEDPQKMPFTERMSEIERYQRIRMGTSNGNPRPPHQTHFGSSTSQLGGKRVTHTHLFLYRHIYTCSHTNSHKHLVDILLITHPTNENLYTAVCFQAQADPHTHIHTHTDALIPRYSDILKTHIHTQTH